jgi:methyl-accepting chemotaxis protein
MKLSIGQKLSAGSGVFVIAMTAMVAGAYVSLAHLKTLQDDGMDLVKVASTAQALSGKGAALYQIIADGEINHELATTKADWAKEKQSTEAMFATLSSQVDTPQSKAELEKARAGYDKYVNLFETQMLPALEANSEMTPEIRALDGEVDAARQSMDDPLAVLAADSQADAGAADARFDTLSRTILVMGTAIALLALLLGTGVNLFVVRHVSRPLKVLSHLLHRLIGGEQIASVPDQGRSDEVGEVARAVSAFQQSQIELRRLEAEQAAARVKLEADAERAREVMATAETFEHKIKAVAERVMETAHAMNAAARTLDGAARDADQRSASMAGATSQSSANLQTVASATEELSASISEIGRQVEETTLMTQAAEQEAHRTTGTVDRLSDAATRIGDVVALIQDIAAQTNLLALNATIEAARAGAAGAGFAVVAGEVKTLSAQTTRATDDIRSHIQTMQEVTDETVAAIRGIGETIGRINSVATSIAAGVTQQSAATAEIAGNVTQVAHGAATINADLGQVVQASQATSETSATVLHSAAALNDQVAALSDEVDSFLRVLRAA